MTDWQFYLAEYIREGEPDRAQRAENWQVAIGLQAVDGLTTSDFLLATAKEHIEGRISIDDAKRRIRSYYEEQGGRKDAERSEEADTVASCISEILGERAFTFSPAQLQTIHRRLFDGLLLRAGKFRTHNITKREWVLKGETVYYASADSISETLKYDFERERAFDYDGLSRAEIISHLADFVSGVWQVHPFSEGNTRTTAVFFIKYLRTLGYEVGNDPFKEHSWYFRNALVRANYSNHGMGVQATTRYLERFLENQLFGTSHDLKNRHMHLDWVEEQSSEDFDAASQSAIQSANQKSSSCTLEEMRLLALLSKKPDMTQKELSDALGVSARTVKTRTVDLQERGLLARQGGKRHGVWEVLVEVKDEQD